MKPLARLLLAVAVTAAVQIAAARELRVGSKAFTESVILGELLTQALRDDGAEARHRQQLGGSRILWDALRGGQIDAYPEYTGTIDRELLPESTGGDVDAMRAQLARLGLAMSAPLGFENTYVIGVRRAVATRLALRRIGDLRAHATLRLGFSNEFLDRGDGWPGLRNRYGLPQRDVRGLQHQLAYRAVEAGQLDVIDLYSTDPEIAELDVAVLEDELGYFPEYRAVVLYRVDASPGLLAGVAKLEGRIETESMMRMNAAARRGDVDEPAIAARFLADLGFGDDTGRARPSGREGSFWRHTREHLALSGLSLLAAILTAIPLGIAAARRPAVGRLVLGTTALVQTIPALALLVFMIPLFGIGFAPACAALYLYSLLPIVRNTVAGLTDLPQPLLESAQALGLEPRARLRLIELPLATRSILAGIKTAAVINVGTATLGALIGAGGYGEPILTGIRLNDVGLILQGAVPAALLALLVQLAFDFLEARLLRGAPAGSA